MIEEKAAPRIKKSEKETVSFRFCSRCRREWVACAVRTCPATGRKMCRECCMKCGAWVAGGLCSEIIEMRAQRDISGISQHED